MLKLAKGSNNPKVVLSARDVHWPSGVAVDSKGNVYVADAGHLPDSDHNRVLKLPADSDSNTPIVLLDHLGGARAVAVDPAGDSVYVADSGNNRVLKVAADSSTTCDASASPPCAITLGFTDLHNPAAVAVDNAGSVYVADDGIPRVHELFKQMAPQTELFTYPPTVLDGPRGVAVDSSFNVYITDFSSNQVLELAKDSPAPPVSAGFTSDHPSGVAVGSSGNVYVTDFGNGGGRVLMLPPLPRE